MDQTYFCFLIMFLFPYLFILSTALFTDIKSMGDYSHNWFDAQKQCLGNGLTIEKNQSDKPYWTGIYRRLTPWINIIGCFSDSTVTKLHGVEKTMLISSVGMCQELCYRDDGFKFAVKMNICLCFERNIIINPFRRVSPSSCNYICEDYYDDIFLGDCGGESAYNIYEFQGVKLTSEETCLSLQCSPGDKKYIPQKCSEALDKVCENLLLPDNGYASSWLSSMEQCKNSQPSFYLSGNFNLKDPYLECAVIPHHFAVFWIGVARQIYTSNDQGRNIEEEQKETFLECQICTNKDCYFKSCNYDLKSSFIFCKKIFHTSQSQIVQDLTKPQGSFPAFTFISYHSTTTQRFNSSSSTANYDKDQLASKNDTQHMSSASDDLPLKIFLPIAISLIALSMSAVGLMFYIRRSKTKKTERTTNEKVDCVSKTSVHSEVYSIQDNSYFVLKQCSKKISKGSDSVNESPYNESEEGVYDHLRDKQVRRPEVEDTYQHASAGVSTDLSEYDTMANAHDKKQEEESSYDYTHTDKNKNYRTDLRAQNHLTDSPYDVAI